MPTSDHAGLTWRKSSYSNASGNACLEVAEVSAGAAVRDSKAPGAGHLTMSPPAWRAFLTRAACPEGHLRGIRFPEGDLQGI